MQESEERDLLARVSDGGPEAWQTFLGAFSAAILRIVGRFARTHDDRMDLFVHVCLRMREGGMRRVRAFRYQDDAPCRFSTYLAVVARNLALDYQRSRDGRLRPFRRVGTLDRTDQLLFELHVREGRGVEEARRLLQDRHGIRLSAAECTERAGRVWSCLSPNQKWRVLARLFSRREPVPIDPVSDLALDSDDAVHLRSGDGDPEEPLRSREAERAFQEAMAAVPARQRVAMTLKFKGGLSAQEAAEFMTISPDEAGRLAREGVRILRERLRDSRVARPDLESTGFARHMRP